MKLCRGCNTVKSLEEFSNRLDVSDGKKSRCKTCYQKWRQKYQDSGRRAIMTQARKDSDKFKFLDKEYMKERASIYREKNPLSVMLTTAKCRAKLKGLEFSIDISDLIMPDKCPIFSIPLFKGKNNCCNNSPSLDRKDNSKGYIKGNVYIISNKANKFKRNFSIEEVESLLKYMKS